MSKKIEEITIKKYPNRRLYDMSTSSYIALGDIKALVEQKAPFKVIDAKTGEDLTRQTLMQILLEEEQGGAPIFSAEMLSQMILMYGNAHRSALGPILGSSLKAFVAGADEMARQAALASIESQRGVEAAIEAGQAAWAELAKSQSLAVERMFGAWIQKPSGEKK